MLCANTGVPVRGIEQTHARDPKSRPKWTGTPAKHSVTLGAESSSTHGKLDNCVSRVSVLELAPRINLLTEATSYTETLTQCNFGASRLQGGGSSALGESSGVLVSWKQCSYRFFLDVGMRAYPILPAVHSPLLFTPPSLMCLSDNLYPAQEVDGLAMAPHMHWPATIASHWEDFPSLADLLLPDSTPSCEEKPR